MTVILGIAAYPEGGVDNQTELVQMADAAMYEAKTAGKNRIVTSGANDAI